MKIKFTLKMKNLIIWFLLISLLFQGINGISKVKSNNAQNTPSCEKCCPPELPGSTMAGLLWGLGVPIAFILAFSKLWDNFSTLNMSTSIQSD